MSAVAPEYPRWRHHPAGQLYAKIARCRTCGQEIDHKTTGMFTLWIDLLTMDDRQTICETCAEKATR